jgi:protein tyrosine/serine phosphatase
MVATIDGEMKVPFERSYWVVPDKLLAGCYPGAKAADQAGKRLVDLLDTGIRSVVNLMEDYETDWKGEDIRHYEEEIQALAEARDLDIECIRMPVPETSIPTIDVMKEILNKIDRSIEEGRPVYVHCWGGKGRTGVVVGCYLVRHGIAVGKDALKMVAELRKNDVARNEPSPENERQRWMVYSWTQGE